MNSNVEMQVIKRNGKREDVSFDKVTARIKSSALGLHVNAIMIAQKVLGSIIDGIKTSELDELTCTTSISYLTEHPDYGFLASRIAISNHHKSTSNTFQDAVERLSQYKTKKGEVQSAVSEKLMAVMKQHSDEIESHIDYNRDYLFDYFGFKTLEKSYLLRDENRHVVERPQHMWMRVALELWTSDSGEILDKEMVWQTYDAMSMKVYTHATPTLFNCCTPRPQLSSCFLLAMKEDSVTGIYKTLGDCAQISKYAGGIGIHVSNVRAKGSLIHGTNGVSNGLLPMLRVFNNTAMYIDQGGGRRNGSFAIYLEPWHADIEDFLQMKMNTGSEDTKARDLFYALWIPDLFMERVVSGGDWTLFCPAEAPGLADVWGDEFKALYEGYEREGRGRKTVKAQKLWFEMLDSQIETGTPYLVYKDAANRKSNQQNLGTIKSSNLCTEIIEYSSPEETAVCNLASMALPSFIITESANKVFDFTRFMKSVRLATRNLDRVIDVNFYPTPEAKNSNMKHRPVGLGVQGLADVFAMLGLSWEEPAAIKLNKEIFACMYYAALEESNLIASEKGSYSSFAGSPTSKGLLQFDLWKLEKPVDMDGTLDWSTLKSKIMTTGLRNSLLVAPMPTASTSQILGFNECIEPFTSNLYTRRTLAGEFILVNKYLVNQLIDLGIWNPELKNKIIANNGSVQGISEIPVEIQRIYKTVWEVKQKILIDMAADRGVYICQSQSLNLFVLDPDYRKLTSMHVYAWQQGLKTGMYYLRTKSAVKAQQFTVEPVLQISASKKEETECLMCSA